MALYRERIFMGDGVELDSWDPKQDDYQDPTFNSYDRGPGRNLVGRQKSSDNCTVLYVQNLPDGITDDGLRNLFLPLGTVQRASVKLSKKETSHCWYGFVHMNTVREAEVAIATLDGYQIGNYRLKVQIALSQEEKEERARKRQEEEEFLRSLESSRQQRTVAERDTDDLSIENRAVGKVKSGTGRGQILDLLTDTDMNHQRTGREMAQRSNGMFTKPHPQGAPGGYGAGGMHPPGGAYPGRHQMLQPETFQGHRPNPFPYANVNNNFGIGRGITGQGLGQRSPYGFGAYDGGYSQFNAYSQRPVYSDRSTGERFVNGIGRGQAYDTTSMTYMPPHVDSAVGRGSSVDRSGYATDTGRSGPKKPMVGSQRPCLYCKKPGSLQCARCKMPYCSKECQVSDWALRHSKMCKDLRVTDISNVEDFETRFDVHVDDQFMERYNKNFGNKSEKDTSSDNMSDHGKGQHKKQLGKQNKKHSGKLKPKNKDSRKQPASKESSPSLPTMGVPPSKVVQFSSLKHASLTVGMPVQVGIFHIESPAKIWLHPAGTEKAEKFKELQEKINKVCSAQGAEKVKLPVIGGVYAAQFADDNEWNRVSVLGLKAPEQATVFFIDFGNTAEVKYTNLLHIPDELARREVQTVQCCLGDLQPVNQNEGWSSNCLKIFRDLLPEMSSCIFQADLCDTKGKYTGQLYLTNEGTSLRDELIRNNVAKPTSHQIMASTIPQVAQELSVGQQFTAVVVECKSPSDFKTRVLDTSRINNYDAMKRDIDVAMRDRNPSSSVYRPCAGEFVLAKFTDNEWYRAEVLAVSDRKAEVFFFDFGNSEEVGLEHICPGADKFSRLPAMSMTAYLHGCSSDPWPENVIKMFKNLVCSCEPTGNPKTIKAVVKSKDARIGLELYDAGNRPVLPAVSAKLTECRTSPHFHGPMKLALDGSRVESVIREVHMCDDFYITNLEAIYDLDFTEAQTQVEDDPPYTKPKPGELVAARFSENRVMYRALVKEVTDAGCNVLFVDFGNGEFVSFKDVRQLDESAMRAPFLTISCKLAGVARDSKDHFDLLVQHKDTQVFVTAVSEQNGVYDVQVYLPSGQCLNDPVETVPALEGAAAALGAAGCSVFTLKDMLQKVPSDQKMKVLVTEVQHPHLLYCQVQDTHALERLDTLAQHMEQFYKEEKVEQVLEPREGQLFCVKVQDNMCRCVVLSRKDKNVEIQLVDYGRVEVVPVSELLPLQKEFLELQPMSLKCGLQGVEPCEESWSPDAVAKVKMIQNTCLDMVIKAKAGGTYKIQLGDTTADVGNFLIENQLAKAGTSTLAAAAAADPPITPSQMSKSMLPLDGSVVEAVAVHIEDFDQIFLQLIPGAVALSELMVEINSACEKVTTCIQPAKGEMVCALWEGQWYRARVDGVKETNCRVFFADYGNYDNVQFSAVKRIDTKFADLPLQAIQCQLANVPIRHDKDQTVILKEALSGVKLDVRVVGTSNNVYEVEIKTEDCVVNDMFKQNEATGLGVPSAAVSQKQVNLLPESSLVSTHDKPALPLDGTEINCVVTDVQNFSKIFVQTMAGFHKHGEVMNDLNRIVETAEKVVPIIGDFVSACFTDNVWYRALVTEVTSSTCTVFFIDYGNSYEVALDSVKKLDPGLLTLAGQAMRCSLDGVADTDNLEAIKQLDGKISGKSVMIRAKGFGNGIYKVQIELDGENINGLFLSKSHASKSLAQGHGLVSSEETEIPLTSMPLPDDGILKECSVAYMTGFDGIFIQDCNGLSALFEVMSQINEKCCTSPEVIKPVSGQYVSAFFQEDQSWYRALVEDVSSSECTVYFVDFGNTVSVELKHIQKLGRELRSLPMQCIKCKLHGVVGDRSKLEAFKVKVDGVHLDVTILGVLDGVYDIEISSNGNSINDDFRELNDSTPAACSPLFAQLVLNEQTVAAATDVADFDCITVQTLEGLQGLNSVMVELNNYCNANNKSFKPVVGDFVCALFHEDNVWYRAHVDDMGPADIKVTFVDYGNSARVAVSNIRKMQDNFMLFPLQGIRCSLHDVMVKNNAVKLEELRKILNPSTVLNIRAVCKNADVFSIEVWIEGRKINELFSDSTHTAVSRNQETCSPSSVQERCQNLKKNTPVDALATHVENVDCMYIQLLENAGQLEELMKILNDNSIKSPVTAVQVGDMVGALFTQDNHWYRAVVTGVTADECSVKFVDYGNVDTVKLTNIRALNQQLLSVPVQTVKCSLENVKPLKDPEKLRYLHSKLSDKKLEVTFIRELNGISEVQIEVEGENINNMFLSHETDAEPTSASEEACLLDSTVTLPVDGSSVEVFASDVQEFDSIYVQTVKGAIEMMTLMEELNEECNRKADLVEPTSGSFVAVLYEEQSWYRGKVVEVGEAHCKIYFCDFGNTAEIERLKIRKLDRKYFVLPSQAVKCRLSGVNIKNRPAEVKRLADNIMNKKLTLFALAEDKGVFEVKLFTDDGNIRDLFQQQDEAVPVLEPTEGEDDDDEEESIRRAIQELQLKLAAKVNKKKSQASSG